MKRSWLWSTIVVSCIVLLSVLGFAALLEPASVQKDGQINSMTQTKAVILAKVGHYDEGVEDDGPFIPFFPGI